MASAAHFFVIGGKEMKKTISLILVFDLIIISFAGCEEKQEDIFSSEAPIEVLLSTSEFSGLTYYDVCELLKKDGFTKISVEPLNDLTSVDKDKDNMVENIIIDGGDIYEAGATYMSDVEIKIFYHNIKMVYVPFSSKEIPKEKPFDSIKQQFDDAGFTNVKGEAIEDLIFGWLTKDGEIETILIGGKESFDAYDTFAFDTQVIIKYHTFPKENKEDIENKDISTASTDSQESVTSKVETPTTNTGVSGPTEPIENPPTHDIMVWISKTGSKYHSSPSCSGMKNPTRVTKSEAGTMGYIPCKRCH